MCVALLASFDVLGYKVMVGQSTGGIEYLEPHACHVRGKAEVLFTAHALIDITTYTSLLPTASRMGTEPT